MPKYEQGQSRNKGGKGEKEAWGNVNVSVPLFSMELLIPAPWPFPNTAPATHEHAANAHVFLQYFIDMAVNQAGAKKERQVQSIRSPDSKEP